MAKAVGKGPKKPADRTNCNNAPQQLVHSRPSLVRRQLRNFYREWPASIAGLSSRCQQNVCKSYNWLCYIGIVRGDVGLGFRDQDGHRQIKNQAIFARSRVSK